jgi:hypothetical protein
LQLVAVDVRIENHAKKSPQNVDSKSAVKGAANCLKDNPKNANHKTSPKAQSILNMIGNMNSRDYGGKKINPNPNPNPNQLTFFQWFLGLDFMMIFSVFCITMLSSVFVFQSIDSNYHDQYHVLLALGDEYYHQIISQLKSLFSQHSILILIELRSLLHYSHTQFASLCDYLSFHFPRIINIISDQLILMLPRVEVLL